MKQNKLLITGCKGLIGRILWKHLSNSFELYGIDRASGPMENNIFQADITFPDQIKSVFDRIPTLGYIVHLAGDSRMDADWESVYANNIGGTENIYEAARTYGVKRIVFASSNHVDGAYEGFPPRLHEERDHNLITTREPIRPDGFYGVSKAAGEALARMYYDVYGLESICIRIGSVTKEDDPRVDKRYQSTWLSHRDLVQVVLKSLQADVKFGIYFGVSNNKNRFWDISNAASEIGYQPKDDASLYSKTIS